MAFKDCKKLKIAEFTEDSNITEIGKYCFKCSGIEYFSVPRNIVTSISGTSKNIKTQFMIFFIYVY